MAPARADAATLLLRALRVSAASHGVAIADAAVSDRPWASATFEGTRHTLRLRVEGAAASRWLALLREAELPMRGTIVADLVVDRAVPVGAAIDATLSALTLAER